MANTIDPTTDSLSSLLLDNFIIFALYKAKIPLKGRYNIQYGEYSEKDDASPVQIYKGKKLFLTLSMKKIENDYKFYKTDSLEELFVFNKKPDGYIIEIK